MRAIKLSKGDDKFENFCLKRINVNVANIDSFCKQEICDFITPSAMKFLERFEISQKFLQIDPEL